MASLPTPGGSIGTWGDKLNAWLLVGHNADGTNSGSVTYVGAPTGVAATDTAAIQAAIDKVATSGGEVLLNEGIYVINATLTLKARVNLRGCGGQYDESDTDPNPLRTVIKLADGANCDMLINDPAAPRTEPVNGRFWQQSWIRGVSFHGNRGNQNAPTTAIVRLTSCWAVDFDHVALLNGAGYGLYVDSCNVITSRRLTINTCHKSPAYFKNSADCGHVLTDWGGGFESALVVDDTSNSTFDGLFYNANPRNTTLSAGIGSSDTTIPVTDASGFPTLTGGTIQIDSEQITYTGRTATSFTGCTRGANSTTPATHTNTTRVQQIVPHADGIHVINASEANRITGRADQNYGSSIYLDGTSLGNNFDVVCTGWGWHNATAQAAINCNGNNNRFAGVIRRNNDGNYLNSYTKIGINWGGTASNNASAMVIDSRIDTPLQGDAGLTYNSHLGGGGSPGGGVQPDQTVISTRGALAYGPLLMEGTGNAGAGIGGGFTQYRPQSTLPGAVSGRVLVYADAAGDAASERLVLIFANGTVVPIADHGGLWKDFSDPVTGQEVFSRRYIGTSAVPLSTGAMRLSYFRGNRTESITKVLLPTGGTAAGATPTLIRIGIYSVAANGNLTLVASTPNNTALMATISNEELVSLSATFSKVEGTLYAYGILVVSGATMPQTIGQAASNPQMAGGNGRPRISGIVTGLSDLPASVAAGSVGTTANVPYALLVP